MLIHVEGGKGGKDRLAMLSPRLLDALRAYGVARVPACGCFPAREAGEHVSVAALQDVVGCDDDASPEQARDGPLLEAELCDLPS